MDSYRLARLNMFKLAMSDLSRRFPVFGRQRRSELAFSDVSGPPTLSPYACAAKRCSKLKVGFLFYAFLWVPALAGNR